MTNPHILLRVVEVVPDVTWAYLCSCGRLGTAGGTDDYVTLEEKARLNWQGHRVRAVRDGARFEKGRPPRNAPRV